MALSGHATDQAVITTMTVGTVLGVFAVAARLFTRIVIVRKAGWDDAIICVGCIFAIVHTVTTCRRLQFGMGQHSWDLSDETKSNGFYWFWISIWVYYAGLFCVKISILLQYLRVFVNKHFKIICYVLIAIVSGCSLWAIFSGIFMCAPIRHFWDKNVEGTCLNRPGVWYSAAGVNAATDFATAILPLPLVSSLPISRQQKLLLMIVFGFGFCTCIVSVLRLVWIYPISITKDVTYESPLSALWSNVELNVGILCSCLPTLRSCMTRLFPGLFPPNASDHGIPSETKPDSSGYESKRVTIEEIAFPLNENDHDLEEQRTSNDTHDSRRRPFSFIACTKHDSSDAVHLTSLRSPPTTASPTMHARKASLPLRVARWRESQLQAKSAIGVASSSPSDKLQQFPNNDSTKNLLSEENEAMMPMPERSRSRDGC
ncbi:hypothetical protein Q7P37_010231 [Cladosporium fusiforme]